MTNGDCIRVEKVVKSFGATQAVHELDLSVPRGSLCGFLGPNGAGKSTTIRMLMSIIRPDAGRISVLDGDAISRKDRIGYLPEERGVYRKMRVGEFLHFIARLKGIPPRGLTPRIKDWLERIGLPDAYRRRCEELSKGMQQKVQFLASIIHEPELIILDEPFSGLDPVNAMLLNKVVRELHAEGRTILFSTHVLHQAEQMCDRIILIDRGRKILDDRLEHIREQFDPHTITAEPLGDARAFAAHAESVNGVESTTIDSAGLVHAVIAPEFEASNLMAEVLAGQSVRSIELGRATLDEVFVQLVGHSVETSTPEMQEAGNV